MGDHIGPLNAVKEECCKTDDLHGCTTRWKVSRRTKPRHSTGVPNRSDSNILARIRESVRRLILPHRSGPGVGRRISDEIVHALLGRSYHISVLRRVKIAAPDVSICAGGDVVPVIITPRRAGQLNGIKLSWRESVLGILRLQNELL